MGFSFTSTVTNGGTLWSDWFTRVRGTVHGTNVISYNLGFAARKFKWKMLEGPGLGDGPGLGAHII